MRREAVKSALESVIRRLEVEEQRANMCKFVLNDVLTRVESHVTRNLPLFPPNFMVNSAAPQLKLYGRPYPRGCLYANLYAPPASYQPRPPLVYRPQLLQSSPRPAWHGVRPLSVPHAPIQAQVAAQARPAVYPRPLVPTFPCPICKRHYSSKQYLQQHCRSQHGRELADGPKA